MELVTRKEAGPFCRTSSSVRLRRGPKNLADLQVLDFFWVVPLGGSRFLFGGSPAGNRRVARCNYTETAVRWTASEKHATLDGASIQPPASRPTKSVSSVPSQFTGNAPMYPPHPLGLSASKTPLGEMGALRRAHVEARAGDETRRQCIGRESRRAILVETCPRLHVNRLRVERPLQLIPTRSRCIPPPGS